MNNIGVVTESKAFDELIINLRKNNYDTKKVSITHQLESFDTLIIDLDYSLEKAYHLLQKVKADYKFSETIIFIVLKSKSEIVKLRSIALSADGYISPSIKIQELIQKIKESHNPDKYLLSIENLDKSVKVKMNGSITHLSEAGAIIKSQSTFTDHSSIKIDSVLFNQLNISEKVISKIVKSNPAIKRSFNTEIKFLNIVDEDRDNIRKMLKNWDVK
jgi:response regulator RpfG family c-di-GMP phosphodiesterase